MYLNKLRILLIVIIYFEVGQTFPSGTIVENTTNQQDEGMICNQECDNGICVHANKCYCWYGYEFIENMSPRCDVKCDFGYERVEGTCMPHCSKPCRGGVCIAPEECNCYPGWEMNDQGECAPICNPECGNGICVGLNVCICKNGYELREEASPQCTPSCRECYGECVAPDKCRCKEPYKTIYLTADNRHCDCLEDCDIKCSKSVCSIPSNKMTSNIEGKIPLNVTFENVSSEAKANECSSNFPLLYTSIGASIITLLIILIIIIIVKYKYFERCDRINNRNMSDRKSDNKYMDMGGYLSCKQAVTKDESIDKVYNEYEYIPQASQLPRDQKIYEEI